MAIGVFSGFPKIDLLALRMKKLAIVVFLLILPIDVSTKIRPIDLPIAVGPFYLLIKDLVGGLEPFVCFHILGMSSSQLTNSNLFQRGRAQPPSSYTFPLTIHRNIP